MTKPLEVIDRSPQFACLDGPAFGGGVGLAFSYDFRLCTTQSTVIPSEAKLDPYPATFSKYVICELGIAFAWVAMLTARILFKSGWNHILRQRKTIGVKASSQR